jgi:hypothetical protein
MMMAFNTVSDNPVDPFDSDSIAAGAHYHVQSVSKSGSYQDIVVPVANYPQAGSSTRYFVELPMIIDQSDLAGSRPITITQETGSGAPFDLTRVGTTPASGEYRLADSSSVRGHVIEVHADQEGETISYDFYGDGSVLNSAELNDFTADTITANNGFIADYIDAASAASTAGLKYKVIEIGDWDMDAASTKVVAHGLGSDYKKIVSVSAIIRHDNDIDYYPINSFLGTIMNAGVSSISAVNIALVRLASGSGGFFDSTSFDSTSYNRGWVHIVYTA